MRIHIQWKGRKPRSGDDRVLDEFRGVLLAALATRTYGTRLQAAGLGTAEAIGALNSIRTALDRLPFVTQAEFRSGLAGGVNSAAPEPRPQRFYSPLSTTPRTAVLMPGFEEGGGVRVFSREWVANLHRFGPEAIAAPLSVLRHLAPEARDLPPLKHAVIVFGGPSEGCLTAADRDRFWEAFQVPLFEQILGFDGRVVASECEAHEGLHALEERAIIEEAEGELHLTSLTDLRHPALRVGTLLTGRAETGLCECGHRGVRLTGLSPRLGREPFFACAAD